MNRSVRPFVAADSDTVSRRWAGIWVAIGAGIVSVTAVYLVLIGNSLVRINADLAVSDRAVTDVSGNAKTLPGQITTVNDSLGRIDTALRALPTDTTQIASNLDAITDAMKSIRGDLGSSAPTLQTVAGNLVTSAQLIDPISADLSGISNLLAAVLTSTGPIHDSLVAINGHPTGPEGPTGLVGVHGNMEKLDRVLDSMRKDLGDVVSTNRNINNDLTRICHSTAINVLHGPQPC